MVPGPRILETAREVDADLIGLSGLITPSLEEMRHVAARDGARGLRAAAAHRRRDDVAAHTAVRIEPAYSGPVVHVVDASRAVGVARALLDAEQRDEFVGADPRGVRDAPARSGAHREEKTRLHPGRGARASGCAIDWADVAPPRPTFLGARAIADQPLEELVERIDWTPFFATWELPATTPRS